jgi:hypothetical protein
VQPLLTALCQDLARVVDCVGATLPLGQVCPRFLHHRVPKQQLHYAPVAARLIRCRVRRCWPMPRAIGRRYCPSVTQRTEPQRPHDSVDRVGCVGIGRLDDEIEVQRAV